MLKLKKCVSCGSFTLKQKCPACGSETKTSHPPKYSFHDKYAAYRRKEKYGS